MKVGLLRGWYTGAAWLSSVRAVRCLVKSTNERNPYDPLPSGNAGNSDHTACLRRRKVGMTSSQYGPYIQGCTRATMAYTERRETARWSKFYITQTTALELLTQSVTVMGCSEFTTLKPA